MSLTVENSNLEDFEKAVNTPEETAKIAAAFAKEEQEFKEKQKMKYQLIQVSFKKL